MPVGDVCVREVLVAERTTTVQEAARLMRQNHVGDIVVVDTVAGDDGRRVPVGIITDRDLVLGVVATKLDPGVFTIGDLITRPLATVREELGVFECIQQMRSEGVRRMPVVNTEGTLVGIVTVDDLIQLLGEELNELGRLISRERGMEARLRQ